MKAPDRTIIITGASSGIGRELAIRSAAPGVLLWLVARNAGDLGDVAALVRQRGGEARVAAMDLADLETSASFLTENFPAGSGVDEVHLAAAVTGFGEVRDMLPEDWDLIYRTNLLSPVQWTVHFYKNMVEARGGKIVLVSSLAAYAGYPTAVAYATAKAGLLGLYRSLVHEGRAWGVGVFIASPGYVDTPIYRKAVFRKTTFEKTMRDIRSLGFGILSSSEAAETILRKVGAGKTEFAFPAYASLMKWIAPRFPFFIGLIHRRMIRGFRSPS